MGKRSGMSEAAVLRKNAKKPFGPWEKRVLDLVLHKRPVLTSGKEQWREECYLNNRYSVQLSDYQTDWGPVIHLWVRCHDRGMPRAWSDLMRIKSELVGEDRLALEVFPGVSDLVDQANLSHLWVMPEDFVLPFTL
jgi:hypothetical protein